MRKYLLLGAVSGFTWAGLAFVLSLGVFGRNIWGGFIASPVIGVLIGFLFIPLYKLPKSVQFAASLLTLYLAVALFGLSIGLYDLTRDIPNRAASFEVVFESVIAVVLGITITGYVLLLWPLAFLNHRLLGRTLKTSNRAA